MGFTLKGFSKETKFFSPRVDPVGKGGKIVGVAFLTSCPINLQKHVMATSPELPHQGSSDVGSSIFARRNNLTLLHSEQPKLHRVLAVLSAIWLM